MMKARNSTSRARGRSARRAAIMGERGRSGPTSNAAVLGNARCNAARRGMPGLAAARRVASHNVTAAKDYRTALLFDSPDGAVRYAKPEADYRTRAQLVFR